MAKPWWISLVLLGVGLLAILGVVVLNRGKGGRQRSKAKLRGFGVSAEVETSNEVTPGVHVEDASSAEGGLIAEDRSGKGVSAQRIQVQKDISLINNPSGGADAPKRRPPRSH